MYRSVDFNPSYGDLELDSNGNISMLYSKDSVDVQRIVTLFNSSKFDYELTPNYGLDLDSYIGESVTIDLALELKERMQTKLKEFLGESNVEILYIIKGNIIHFRLLLTNRPSINFLFLKEQGFQIENV